MNPAYETTPETQEGSDRRDRWAEVKGLEGPRKAQQSGTSLLRFARQQIRIPHHGGLQGPLGPEGCLPMGAKNSLHLNTRSVILFGRPFCLCPVSRQGLLPADAGPGQLQDDAVV